MSLKTELNYVSGVPQTTVAGFAPRGLSWHWTAGGTGRAGAESVIRGFVATRYTTNASYHVLLWHEHEADGSCVTYAMWIVPATKASHSMNPAHAFLPKYGDAEENERFAEVHRILGRDFDPNADCISVSYCGMPADFGRDMKCPVFVADVRELARLLIERPSVIDRPHFGHGWIQPTTRYEMDDVPNGTDMLISRLYNEDEMTWINETRWYKEPKRLTFQAGASYRTSPTLDDTGVYVAKTDETRVVIGEVNGVDFGAGPLWYVIGGDSGVAKVVHSQDKIAEVPLGTGVTQAQLDAVKLNVRDETIREAAEVASAAIKAIE